MNSVICTCLAAAILWIGCPQLNASAILWDTFGPGLTVNNSSWTGCGGSTCADGTPFVPAVTAQLETVAANLGFGEIDPPPGDQYNFSIWTGVAGSPGAPLESWSLDAPPVDNTVNFTFTSVVQPTLLAGVQYWAVYTTTSPSSNTQITWGLDSSAPPGGVWFGSSPTELGPGGTDAHLPALLVTGVEPVPEPGTLGSASAGLVVLAGYLLRRRR